MNVKRVEVDWSSSRIKHIFNSTQLNLTRNQVNSTWLIKNSSLTSRELNIEIFPVFDFCITFLHYLLIESHEEKHEDRLIESHEEKHKEKHEEKHEDHLIESHDGKTWRETWRKTWRLFDFDRKSWRKNMIESHEEKLCKLFDQAIYIYLISCWIESSFQVELSSQASQFDSSSQIQLLNLIQHFFKKISTRLNTFQVEYSTQTQVLNLNSSTQLDAISLNKSQWSDISSHLQLMLCFNQFILKRLIQLIWSFLCLINFFKASLSYLFAWYFVK